MLMNIIAIGMLIATGTAAAPEQIAGSSTVQVDASGPALLALAGLPGQEGPVNAVAYAKEREPREQSSRPPRAGAAATGKSEIWSFVPTRDSFRADGAS